MTLKIIFQIILFGIALSMDAFAVSVTDGLTYSDINKKKGVFIAGVFGVMQALMPLIGYWLVELITILVDSEAGAQAGKIMSLIVTWIAFALLLFIGGKMLVEGILDLKKDEEGKEVKLFSYKEVLLFGVATSIDALATGVAFHAGISTNITIWLHVVIIMCITFVISFAGVVIAKQVQKLLKGRYEITAIIGGIILLSLAVWIVLSHYLGI